MISKSWEHKCWKNCVVATVNVYWYFRDTFSAKEGKKFVIIWTLKNIVLGALVIRIDLFSKSPSKFICGWQVLMCFRMPFAHWRQTFFINGYPCFVFNLYHCVASFSAIFAELLKTEEEFVQSLHHLVNTYVNAFEEPSTPNVVRQMKEQLTLNIRELHNFHTK